LDVVARNRDRFEIVALTAFRDVEAMLEQCVQWSPRYAVMADEDAAERLQREVRSRALAVEVLGGPRALETVAEHEAVGYVMAGIVGAAGLMPTLAAARAGKRVLLANKEALVMSGRVFIDAVVGHGAELIPIDSEHNAIFQCLPRADRSPPGRSHRGEGVRRILLTGSGGPFRLTPRERMDDVTPEAACAHPNWVMGRKISVDSATMMNKGLEVIEACWLFGTGCDRVEVVIHPQSIVHSMAEYEDGSVLAQLGHPDMRTPIAHALAWPVRVGSGAKMLDFNEIGRLDFEAPDFDKTPCLRLGFEAAAAGGTTPATLNAANEIAVSAFLDRIIRFTDIPRVIEATLGEAARGEGHTLGEILDADRCARTLALEHVSRSAAPGRAS